MCFRVVRMRGGWRKMMKDIYDWVEEMGRAGCVRRCPKCNETDVKFATHNDCGFFETSSRLGESLEQLVKHWYQQRGTP